jgi:DNA mismatch repair protein MutS
VLKLFICARNLGTSLRITKLVLSLFIDPNLQLFLVTGMTPLMRQYWDIKSAHEDKILLFRMGDFFEMFFDDAKKAAPILGIALTQRNKKSEDETPMCGMPHHSVAGPINKLLKHGLKVAICDQIEDPKTAKGIVKRAVTRVLTPGMVYDPDTLETNISNYLGCLDTSALACVETSTGECFYFEDLQAGDIKRLLGLLPIAELVLAPESEPAPYHGLVSRHAGLDRNSSLMALPLAARRLLSYVESLGGVEALQTLTPFEKRSLHHRLDLSPTVLRHLEIFSTYKGEGSGSLFEAIDRTKTSAGARALRQWLLFPLTIVGEITERQNRIESWVQDPGKLKALREVLAQMGDIERRLGKIAQPQCNGRDLLALSASIEAGLSALEIAGLANEYQHLRELGHEISRTLVEEPPLQVRQGHLIQKGFSPELDELIALSTDSQSLLAEMESREKLKTGISSLKIRYNNVFGYYIEVTNTHSEKVPSHYMRKQTLTNAERYTTDELVELEKKVLSAQTKRSELEYEIFEALRRNSLRLAPALANLAASCSETDVVSALAWLAIERRYVRPQFTQDGSLEIKASRHPVVEQTVKKQFVANDLMLSPRGCLLLTGPNMAGKSTLMRQVALTSVLAQIGSFVPADSAKLPVFDHVFTRIGASDQLSEGLSTFMVEMTETAEMLKKSTKASLLILDEIGRGTSTFDGMSLAQAILEYLLTYKGAMTFFATHYHELTALEGKYRQLRNAHMTVLEKNGEIHFLHTLKLGPAQKSYGIQVAKLAGLPAEITERATGLLKNLELKPKSAVDTSQLSLMDAVQAEMESSGPSDELKIVLKDLRDYPLSTNTPIEAMNRIAKWQEALKVSPETGTLS